VMIALWIYSNHLGNVSYFSLDLRSEANRPGMSGDITAFDATLN
jgi:hypothetical protein